MKTAVRLSRRKRGSQSQPPIFCPPPETGSLTQQEATGPSPLQEPRGDGEGSSAQGGGRAASGTGPSPGPQSPAPCRVHLGRGGPWREARGLAGVPALATCHPSSKAETRQSRIVLDALFCNLNFFHLIIFYENLTPSFSVFSFMHSVPAFRFTSILSAPSSWSTSFQFFTFK